MGYLGLISRIISIITKMFSWLCLLVLSILQVTMAVDINTNALEGLPSQQIFQPQPPPKIPVRDGERRCDNYYNGAIPPCSYSTTEADNGEYRRRRRSERVWRTIA